MMSQANQDKKWHLNSPKRSREMKVEGYEEEIMMKKVGDVRDF